MGEFNKRVFVSSVCPTFSNPLKIQNDGYIHTFYWNRNTYDYDYSHAILTYMKECGCKLIYLNDLQFRGQMSVTYLEPQVHVDQREFAERYAAGEFKPSKVNTLIYIIYMLILCSIVLYVFYMFNRVPY